MRLGAFTLLEAEHPTLWAFTRASADTDEPPLVVVANLSSSDLELSASVGRLVGAFVLGNLGEPPVAGTLRPWEARVHECR